VTAWVAGTHAGQATAAAIAAVVIGGTAVVATSEGGGSPDTPAVAATTTPTAGLPGPGEPGTTTSRAAGPSGASGTATPSAGGATPSGSPAGPGQDRGASGQAPGVSGPPPSGGRPPTPPSAAPSPPRTSPTRLVAGSPTTLGTLRVGAPGDVTVTIRNSGAEEAYGLVVTLRLPAGLTAQGGSGSNGWQCTAGAITTCTLDDLGEGEETTVHVRMDVAAAAVPGGTVTGTVRAQNGAIVGIPARRLAVLP
jgi:uncharacterized repeat protein (TIGR01451 family)